MATASLSPKQKLSAARLVATRRCPYFTTALLSLVPREQPGLGTMAVSHNLVLLWDPKVVEARSVQQTACTLLHEVGHVLRDHHKRCAAGGYDPVKWNLAADAEINDDLAAMKLDMHPGMILPRMFQMKDGLTAEEYMGAFPPDACDKAPQSPDAGAGWCGSGAGRAVADEPEDGDPQGRSPQDVQRVRAQTAAAVRDHVAQHGQGSVPGDWERWAEVALAPPRIPWQQKLARVVRSAIAYRPGAVDYRFSKMSRRQSGLGFGAGRPILPALVAPVPRVMVAIDTSGSMGSAELTRAVAEVAAILAAVGAPADFVACDAEVHADAKVRSWRDVVANLKGGGGTSFVPVFEAAARKRPAPEILVFATDGCGPAPLMPPAGMKVIWLLVGPYQQKPYAYAPGAGGCGEVTYGEFIEVDHDAKAEE